VLYTHVPSFSVVSISALTGRKDATKLKQTIVIASKTTRILWTRPGCSPTMKREPRKLVILVQISTRNRAEENETVLLMQGKNHNKALLRTYKTAVIEPEIGHNSKRAETAQVQTRTDRIFSPSEMPEWSESVKILSFLFPFIQKHGPKPVISVQRAERTASSGRPKGRYAAANHETENRQASWHSCNAQTLSHLQRPNRCDHRQHGVKEQSVCITSSARPTLPHSPHIRSQDQRQQGSERKGFANEKAIQAE